MLKDLVETFLYNRHPLKVSISYEGVPIPHVRVSIQNQTPGYDVHIHEVRIHHGMRERSLSFVLWPSDKVTIAPKDKAEWALDYEPARTIVKRLTETKQPPPYLDPDEGPGIDSPADLFNAIGMGRVEDSWIELDFNEYERREFKKGKVKEIFDSVGRATRELRKKKLA